MPTNETQLRHWSRRWSAGGLGGVVALFGLAIPASDLPLGAKLATCGALLVVEFLCYRGLLMGVDAGEGGLVVTNLLGRRRIAWDDITEIATRGRGAEAKIVVLRAQGDEVNLSSIMPAVWAPHRDETVASIERTLLGWLNSARTR